MDERNFAVVSFLSHADADDFSPCFLMTSTLTFYSMSSKRRYRQLQIFKRGLPRTKSISRGMPPNSVKNHHTDPYATIDSALLHPVCTLHHGLLLFRGNPTT